MRLSILLPIFLIIVGTANAVEPISKADLYVYKAKIVRVVDGDTVDADVDLGFHTWRREERLRLARVNAPEPRGAGKVEGLKSKQWLKDRVEGREVLIRTIKDRKEKYGRYLVEIFFEGVNINDELLAKGFAVRWVE